LLAGPAVAAQRLPTQEPSPLAEEQDEAVTRLHTLVDEVELAELLDICSTTLSLALEYDRDLVQGSVTIRSGDGLTTLGFWAMTNRLLAERGLACIQGAGEASLGIVKLDQAKDLARVEPGPIEDARAGYVKVIRELHNADPEAVVAILEHVLTAAGSHVLAIPESSQVVVAGQKPAVVEALSFLERLEVSDEEVLLEEIAVRNLPPTAIVGMLERVGQSLTKVRGTPMRGAVLADPNSDRVLIIAPASEMEFWIEQVQHFDRTQATQTREYTPLRFGLESTASLIADL
jgi:hypothetical protein